MAIISLRGSLLLIWFRISHGWWSHILSMNIFRKYPPHPLFIAAYPVLALYAANATQLAFSDVSRSLLALVGSAAVLLLLLTLLGLDGRRAAGAVSITYALFFSFGHVFAQFPRTTMLGMLLGQMRVLLAIWAAGWILLTWFFLRKLKALDGVTLFLNAAAIGLAAITVIPLLTGALAGKRPAPPASPLPQVKAQAQASPDIYYIILDGYVRDDLMQEIFSYDNSDLIQFLESRGFYVARESYSNYGQTATSLASSLNYDYVNQLSQAEGPDSRDYQPLRALIKDSRARRFLEQQGYRFVTFESAYELTGIQDADVHITFGPPFNNFESLLIQNSVAVLWVDQTFKDRYRARVTGAFERLGDLSDIPSPKFVFAHIMAAHQPFMFGPNGEPLEGQSAMVQRETGGKSAEKLEQFRGQVTYINSLVEDMIDNILRSSPEEPVILLQADHGSAIYSDWTSISDVCFHERMAILNAYYLPGRRAEMLYPGISPVNSFRVVFDTYFDAGLELLPDEHYYSTWLRPYDFVSVNDTLETPCAQP